MSKPFLRWMLLLLRYGLCVVAIAWLVHTVPWYDYVRLTGPKGPMVRLVEQPRGDEFVILRDGRQETIPLSAVHRIDVNGQSVPEIERGIATVVPKTDKWLALWAIIIFIPVIAIQSWRLVVMLAVQDVRLGLWPATKLTVAGNFFNFALPGTTGGDLIKAYYLTHYTHLKTEAVTTVFLDRAIGLFGLVMLAGAAILFTSDPSQFGQLIVTLLVICAVLGAGCIVVFSRRIRGVLRLKELAARLPMGDQLLRVGRATVAMRHHKLLIVVSLLMTFVLQGICMFSAAIMAHALGMEGGWSHYFVYVSIGFLIAAIPIAPPQAFGVLEYFYVKFFTGGALHNDPSQAVALALAVRLIQLVWALPGVLVPLLGAHLPSKAQLAELEVQPDAAANTADAVTNAGAAVPEAAAARLVEPP
jgi:hypothetical protein